MSFTHIETQASDTNSNSGAASLTNPVSVGDLLIGIALTVNDSDLSLLTVQAGYVLAGALEENTRTVAVYYKEAVGGEDTFTVESSDTDEEVGASISRYSKTGSVGVIASVSGMATNDTSITVGPVATEPGALLFAAMRGGSSDNFGDFTQRLPSPPAYVGNAPY